MEAQEEDDDNEMQRALAKKRLPVLVDYLTEVPDHFLSSVTLVITPRDLSKPALEAKEPGEDGEFRFERAAPGALGRSKRGTLYLSGTARLFPADGQHRVAAAAEAVAKDPKLAKEDVPVVLLIYHDPGEVRQRFSDLNLNAKPVNKSIGYDFDTRSAAVQLAKEATKVIELFQGRVNRMSNSLSKTSVNVIAINSLVEGTRALAAGFVRHDHVAAGEEDPTNIDVATLDRVLAGPAGKTLQAKVLEAWTVIIGAFDKQWEPVLDGVDGAAGQLRDEYVFPHGIGWQALAMAAADLIAEHGDAWTEIFEAAVTEISWERNNPEFEGRAVIKDPIKGTFRVNNTGPGIKALKDYILDKAKESTHSATR